MKKIKISFFTHFLIFILNSFFLIWIFITLENIFSTVWFLYFFIILVWNLIYFFLLKIKKIWIILFLIFTIISVFLVWISENILVFFSTIIDYFLDSNNYNEKIFLFSYIFIIFIALISFIKNILLFLKVKKWLEIEKSNGKIFFSILIFQIIFFIIFRYWYYFNEKEIEEVPENFLQTKMMEKDFDDEKNLYLWLKEISEKYKIYDPKELYIEENILIEKFPEKYSESKIKQYEKDKNSDFLVYSGKAKNIIFTCLYENRCYWDRFFYKILIQNIKNDKENFSEFFTEEELKLIDEIKNKIRNENKNENEITTEFIKNLWEQKVIENLLEKVRIKKFLRENIDIFNSFSKEKHNDFFLDFEKLGENYDFYKEEFLSEIKFSLILIYARESISKIIYFLEIWDEKSALKIIENNFKINDIIISWDSSLIWKLTAVSNLNINLTNLFYILENKKVSKNFKNELKNILENTNFNIDFENVSKFENLKDHYLLNLDKQLTDYWFNLSIYNPEKTKKLFNYYNYLYSKDEFENEEKYLLFLEKINISPFKSNYLWKKIIPIPSENETYKKRNDFVIFLKNEIIKKLEN